MCVVKMCVECTWSLLLHVTFAVVCCISFSFVLFTGTIFFGFLILYLFLFCVVLCSVLFCSVVFCFVLFSVACLLLVVFICFLCSCVFLCLLLVFPSLFLLFVVLVLGVLFFFFWLPRNGFLSVPLSLSRDRTQLTISKFLVEFYLPGLSFSFTVLAEFSFRKGLWFVFQWERSKALLRTSPELGLTLMESFLSVHTKYFWSVFVKVDNVHKEKLLFIFLTSP